MYHNEAERRGGGGGVSWGVGGARGGGGVEGHRRRPPAVGGGCGAASAGRAALSRGRQVGAKAAAGAGAAQRPLVDEGTMRGFRPGVPRRLSASSAGAAARRGWRVC